MSIVILENPKTELETGISLSASYLLWIYSYRARYNGLLATFFLSSQEILRRELTLLNPTFSCGFFTLTNADLDKVSLQEFLS
jgi:hypothetical protein